MSVTVGAKQLNSFLDLICRLLVIFANSLDSDQDRQNVGPDLASNRWHFDSVLEFLLL